MTSCRDGSASRATGHAIAASTTSDLVAGLAWHWHASTIAGAPAVVAAARFAAAAAKELSPGEVVTGAV